MINQSLTNQIEIIYEGFMGLFFVFDHVSIRTAGQNYPKWQHWNLGYEEAGGEAVPFQGITFRSSTAKAYSVGIKIRVPNMAKTSPPICA